MKRLLGTVGLAAVIAALVVGRPLGAQSAPKRPLTVDDVVAFKSMGVTVLSPDGAWLAYRMGPQEGDAEVIVRQTAGDKEMRFPVGQGTGLFAYSDDSAWIGITTSATKREADAARRTNRTLQTGVTLVNLATGDKTSIPKIRRFAFDGELGGCARRRRPGRARGSRGRRTSQQRGAKHRAPRYRPRAPRFEDRRGAQRRQRLGVRVQQEREGARDGD
jgi:hypothetical protein